MNMVIEMKKIIKYLLIAFLGVILLSGCSKSHITDITLDELKTKIENKDTFALYVGNEGCSHCVSYRPVLENVLDEYNIDIYHLDNALLTEDELSEMKNYINISGTPTVAFFTEGEEETTLYRITGEVSKEVTIQKFKDNGYIK